MQQIQQNLALNKCPHGFPVGTCPICSSSGGASKDKNKPRVAGEMSYNECMAVWIKMQAAKEAKIQERIDKLQEAHQRLIFNRIISGLIEKIDNIQKFIDKVIDKIPQGAKAPFNIIINTVNFIKNAFVSTIKVLVNTFNSMSNFISSVTEKLASVYGEIKNFINTQLEKKIKKPIKIFLSFFTQTSEEDEEDKKKIEDLLKRIKKAIKLKRKKKDDEDYDV